jgi:hypothetical protein
VSLLRLFFSPLDPNCETHVALHDEDRRRPLSVQTNLLLLSGAAQTGKTSLAWAFCQSVCHSLDGTAYVICDRRRLENGHATPFLTEGSSMSSSVWQRVNVKYVESISEVLQVLSCLHELPAIPKCVVVDLDWVQMLSGCSKADVAKNLGKVASTIAQFAEFAKRVNCTCIVTDSGSDPLIDLILRRYLTNVVSLTSVNNQSAVLTSCNVKICKYSLVNSSLVLNVLL